MHKITLVIVAAYSAIAKKVNTGLVLGLLAAAVAVGVSAYTKGEKVEAENLATTMFIPASLDPDDLKDPANWTLANPDCDGGYQLCAIEVNNAALVNNLPSSDALEKFEPKWQITAHGQEVENSGIIVRKYD